MTDASVVDADTEPDATELPAETDAGRTVEDEGGVDEEE